MKSILVFLVLSLVHCHYGFAGNRVVITEHTRYDASVEALEFFAKGYHENIMSLCQMIKDLKDAPSYMTHLLDRSDCDKYYWVGFETHNEWNHFLNKYQKDQLLFLKFYQNKDTYTREGIGIGLKKDKKIELCQLYWDSSRRALLQHKNIENLFPYKEWNQSISALFRQQVNLLQSGDFIDLEEVVFEEPISIEFLDAMSNVLNIAYKNHLYSLQSDLKNDRLDIALLNILNNFQSNDLQMIGISPFQNDIIRRHSEKIHFYKIIQRIGDEIISKEEGFEVLVSSGMKRIVLQKKFVIYE